MEIQRNNIKHDRLGLNPPLLLLCDNLGSLGCLDTWLHDSLPPIVCLGCSLNIIKLYYNHRPTSCTRYTCILRDHSETVSEYVDKKSIQNYDKYIIPLSLVAESTSAVFHKRHEIESLRTHN